MIFRVMALTLLISINAIAKPINHLTSDQGQQPQAKETAKSFEDDLSRQLTSHSWQITNIPKQSEFKFDEHHWIFNFTNNGKYKAFGTCNYLTGSYKTDNTGAFRISNLDGSNNHCENAKEDEAKVFNMLLMADSLVIKGESLILKTNGQALIELKATNNQAIAAAVKKKRSDERLGSTNSKKVKVNKTIKSKKHKARKSSSKSSSKKDSLKRDAKNKSSKYQS
jgi:heat shock protein HslJ